MTTTSTNPSKKRNDKIVEFKLPMLTEDEAATADSTLFSLLGLAGGVMGILQKNKYILWLALFFNVVAFFNQRKGQAERARSGLSAISFSVMGLGMLYTQLFFAPRNASIFSQQRIPSTP